LYVVSNFRGTHRLHLQDRRKSKWGYESFQERVGGQWECGRRKKGKKRGGQCVVEEKKAKEGG
jgi:hypothetical protein